MLQTCPEVNHITFRWEVTQKMRDKTWLLPWQTVCRFDQLWLQCSLCLSGAWTVHYGPVCGGRLFFRSGNAISEAPLSVNAFLQHDPAHRSSIFPNQRDFSIDFLVLTGAALQGMEFAVCRASANAAGWLYHFSCSLQDVGRPSDCDWVTSAGTVAACARAFFSLKFNLCPQWWSTSRGTSCRRVSPTKLALLHCSGLQGMSTETGCLAVDFASLFLCAVPWKSDQSSVCAINLLLYLSDSPPVLCHPDVVSTSNERN